jgi:hypothetical protein
VFEQGESQAVQRLPVLRLQAQGLAQLDERLVHMVQADQREAEIGASVGVRRTRRH